jgi:hypothetical protein
MNADSLVLVGLILGMIVLLFWMARRSPRNEAAGSSNRTGVADAKKIRESRK